MAIIRPDRGSAIETVTGQFIREDERISVRRDHPMADPNQGFIGRQKMKVDRDGLVYPDFDESTAILCIPPYAHTLSDYLMNAIVRGNIGSGIHQTPMPMLSSLVSKRGAIVYSWDIKMTGRTNSVRRANNVLSAAEDGAGIKRFMQSFISDLDINNAGCFIATQPIHYSIDKWNEYGMDVVFTDDTETVGYMTVTDSAFRENRGLWTLDRMLCYPTGNPEWPFWYYTYSVQLQKEIQVLIPKNVGIQEIQPVTGKSTEFAGYGQSGVWRVLPYVVKNFLFQRHDYEKLLASPPRGIVYLTGADMPGQMTKVVSSWQQDQKDQDNLVYPGVMFLDVENHQARIGLIPYTETPEGYTPATWQTEKADAIAAGFHMSSTQLQIRTGEGAMTQSDVASAMESESAMAWLIARLEAIAHKVSPTRVIYAVKAKSSRRDRHTATTLDIFADAVAKMQAIAQEGEEPVLTRPELRAMMQQIAFEIPDVDEQDETDEYKPTRVELQKVLHGLYGLTEDDIQDVESGDWVRGLTVGSSSSMLEE